MAKLPRQTLIQFGKSGPSTDFGQFGSKLAGLPQTSQNPSIIQALAAWVDGWQDAVVAGDKAAYLEDMNGWCFVHSYMMAYMFQAGISEWDSSTTYFIGSVVQDATSGLQWFVSLQDNNTGNAPPASASNAFWRWVNPPQDLVGAATLNKVPKVTSTAPANGVAGSVTLGDSTFSDDGANAIIGLPLKFPDNTVQSTAAINTAVAAQSVVTGSRSLGTVFHNTGSKPLFVMATVLIDSSNLPSSGLATVYTDASATPTTEVGHLRSAAGGTALDGPIFFVVLPGNYYKITGGASLVVWTEWT